MRTSMFRILLDADPVDGGGDPPKLKASDDLTRRLKSHDGNAAALAGELHAENRHLQSTIADLRKRLPVDGAIVLIGADVTTWNAVKELGPIDDIKAGLSERDTLRSTNARHERDNLVSRHGYKPHVLGPLLPVNAKIVEKDGEKGKDGKTSKVLEITIGDGADAKPVPFSEFIASNLADYAPVIGGPETADRPKDVRGAPPSPPSRQRAPEPGEVPREPVDVARRELVSSGLYNF